MVKLKFHCPIIYFTFSAIGGGGNEASTLFALGKTDNGLIVLPFVMLNGGI